jgi:hypothetical protein
MSMALFAFATRYDREFIRLAIQNDLRLLAHRTKY